ncbi:MAG: NYN domain-containing protein [Prosthecobacter sp.]|nr:NYN domain-containing protein [Prosthecobacter sp.]
MSPPTPRSYLLVDGHNVMHAWPDLRRHLQTAAKRYLAQQELLQRLRHFQDMTGTQVVVVFDGTHAQRSEEREKDGLQIIYADASSTADAILERLAAKYAHQHPLRVVSADGLVRDAILACGAEWLSPEMLLLLCADAEKDMRGRLENL